MNHVYLLSHSQVVVQGGTGITDYVHSVLLVHGVLVMLAVRRTALVSTVCIVLTTAHAAHSAD